MERGTGRADARRTNAALAWASVACIAAAAANSAVAGDVLWAGLGVVSIVVLLVPAVAYRRATAMLPWEVALFAAVPLVSESFGILLPRSVATFLVVPALALALAAEFDAFTSVEMSPGFAVLFVVTVTMAAAGAWAVARWVADLALGTDHLRSLDQAMWSMVAATATGLATGGVFAAYLRRVSAARLGFQAGGRARATADEHEHERRASARAPTDRWPHLSERRQRQLVRGLQLALVGVLAVGLYRRSVGVVANTLIALGVTELPALLERDYRLPIDARLTLWIVVPVFLHAVGTLGPYRSIPLWDNLTHALSSSLVAAAGYTTVRAFDVHSDAVYLPRRFVAAFILVFTLAFGVFWELLEFALDGAAALTGTESLLTQYTLANTMVDIVFDAVGAVAVAVWGSAHLSGVSDAVADRLGEAGDDRESG